MDDSSAYPYRLRQDFLSSAEGAFFRVLQEMVRGRLHICPKVSLQDLFFTTRPNENILYANKLQRKHIDFLLLRCDTLKPALAVQLDYPRQADHRQAEGFLDNLCAAAALPLVYVIVRPTYDVPTLAADFAEAMKKVRGENALHHTDFSPICPKCGITMVLRFFKDGPKKGERYYGCLNFPQCQETVEVGTT
jgi:hypothetical protein